MARTALTVTVKIAGVREVLRAYNALPKNLNALLRQETLRLSQKLASNIRQRAVSEGRQAALLARTVKAKKDRVPVVTAGGTVRLGRNMKPAFKMLFGSEFGSTALHQFKPPAVSGYWLFPAVKDMQPEIEERWLKVADEIVDEWGR